MRHYGFRRRIRRRKMGNSVIHLPSTMGSAPAANTAFVFVLASPSILAGGSASDNIEAQDKDRTVNVGHHVGTFNIDLSVRSTTGTGIVEMCVFKVERSAITPVLGTFPVPSSAEILAAGIQQECRLKNPGKVFHYSKRAYAISQPVAHKIKVSPAKFKLSKMKAGDHWILLINNRGGTAVVIDTEVRYKEYE